MWFGRDELQAWMASSGQSGPSGEPEQADLRDGNFNRCPKCEIESLQRFDVGQIRGAHCRECGGIWQSAVDAHRLRLAAKEAHSISRSGAAGAGVDEAMARIIASLLPAL